MAEESSLPSRLMCLSALTVQQSRDPELETDLQTIDEAKLCAFTGLEKRTSLAPNDKFAATEAFSGFSSPRSADLGVSYAVFGFLPGCMTSVHPHPGGTGILYSLGMLSVGLAESSVCLRDATSELLHQSSKGGELCLCSNGSGHHQSEDDPAQAAASQSLEALISSSNPEYQAFLI